MTAPVLAHKKFWIVKPKAGRNYVKNPRFDKPDGVEDWTAAGAGVTIELTGDYARRGAYSLQVNTATGVASSAYYDNVSVTSGLDYTFSVDVKGVAGQAMRIVIADSAHAAKATKTFTATGYWQRVEVTLTAAETKADYELWVTRDAVASTAVYYVDGAQFEQESKATTFIHGYGAGCKWDGAIRNSDSIRSAYTGLGGELLDLDDYCSVASVTGLGHGDWNQIVTKMTSGGDLYQDHIRKSRQFSIVVDFTGDTLGEIETNRKALIDALRPDLLDGAKVDEQFGINWGSDVRPHGERIIRYQGFADNGDEATNPIDIRCVPLPNTLTDTPDLPTYQRDMLNFAIPSGLLDGAYNEGTEMELYAEFPAEYIVKRDPDGNWCKWNGAAYENPLAGVNGI
ncbi:MAG: carbohydrate binding domain-containing protein, partial [Minisyncoccales bacterium]